MDSIGDATSSSESELSDVPPSSANESTHSFSATPQPGEKYRQKGRVRFEHKMNGESARSPGISQLPALTPATAEILARVNGMHPEEKTQFSSSNGEAPSKKIHEQPSSTHTATISNNAGSGSDQASTPRPFPTTIAPKPSMSSSQAPTPPSSHVVSMSDHRTSTVFAPTSYALPSQNAPLPGSKIIIKLSNPGGQKSNNPSGVKDTSSSVTPSTTITFPSIPSVPSGLSQSFTVENGEVNASDKTLERGPSSSKSGGPRTTGKKRKRGDDSDGEVVRVGSSPSDDDDSDSFIPQETTKSGRQVHRPSPFVPPESPQSKKPRPEPKPKKKTMTAASGKGREQNILCEHCLRGNGPIGNVIVFCDGCNRAWHQNCHEPRITKDVVTDTAKDWFCAECTTSNTISTKRKKGRPKKDQSQQSTPDGSKTTTTTTTTQTQTPPVLGPTNVFTPGRSLTRQQQEQHLSTLSKNELINHILNLASQNPNLPIFPPSSSSSTIPTNTTTITTPMPPPATPTTKPLPPPTDNQDSASTSSDEYIYDEHALLYPKAGHGIKLPPESEDVHLLLESPESRTFSHALRPDVRPVMGVLAGLKKLPPAGGGARGGGGGSGIGVFG